MEVKIPPVEKVTTGSLVVDKKNPNIMSNANFNALKECIKKYGFLTPIITNKDLVIADGYHRWKAAHELGLTEVPVIKLDVGEVDRRIIRQVMNKLRGEHDFDLDLEEFRFLFDEGALENIKNLLPEENFEGFLNKEVVEDNFDIKQSLINPKYNINQGDIYILGCHRLICADSTKQESYTLLMDGKKADLVITDPPFNISYMSMGKKRSDWIKSYGKDNKPIEEYKIFLLDCFFNIKQNLKSNGIYYIWSGWNSYQSNWQVLENLKLLPSACIIWDKGNPGMGFGDYRHQYELANLGINNENLEEVDEAEFIFYGFKKENKEKHFFNKKLEIRRSDLWQVKRDPSLKYFHPTQKPLKLAEKAIRNSSIENDIVLDIFGGSGWCLLACEQLNRKCFMIEFDPKFCSVIIERWEAFTNKKAVKL